MTEPVLTVERLSASAFHLDEGEEQDRAQYEGTHRDRATAVFGEPDEAVDQATETSSDQGGAGEAGVEVALVEAGEHMVLVADVEHRGVLAVDHASFGALLATAVAKPILRGEEPVHLRREARRVCPAEHSRHKFCLGAFC